MIAQDAKANQKRFQIEDDVFAMIALRQPIASDLRRVAAMLEFASELERIGDYAKGIGNINLLIGDEKLMKPLIDHPSYVRDRHAYAPASACGVCSARC